MSYFNLLQGLALDFSYFKVPVARSLFLAQELCSHSRVNRLGQIQSTAANQGRLLVLYSQVPAHPLPIHAQMEILGALIVMSLKK